MCSSASAKSERIPSRYASLALARIASKAVTIITQSDSSELHDFAWSPDSQWLTFTKPESRRFPDVQIYGLEAKNTVTVTDGWFDRSATPSFDGCFVNASAATRRTWGLGSLSARCT